MTSDATAPYHAHIYHDAEQRAASDALHARLTELKETGELADLLMVGKLRERPVGPHPLPQFEIHFLKRALPAILPLIEASGLRALVHPLTDDDLADHTTLAQWIGPPLDLDLSVMDPPGRNQGVPRFGRVDF
jgi:aromatic ring-cleaving dioxygenase